VVLVGVGILLVDVGLAEFLKWLMN